MELKNISYRKYEPKDFESVFKLFIKFQTKAEVSLYHSLGKGQSNLFLHPYLSIELKKLIKKHKYHYVGINEENGKIIGYACFDDSITIDGGIDLILVFKDEKSHFGRIFKYLLLLAIKKEFPDKRVFAVLSKRNRFDTYVKFIKRVFKVHVMRKDSFGRIYIEFLK
jgi:hypothetical protein